MHLTLPFVHPPLRVEFRPRWWATLLVAAAIPAFVGLGNWQLGKAQTKEAAQARLDAGRAEAPVALGAAPVADPAALHLRPVTARGEYDASGQILIDNRVLHERAGLHVLTPLRIEGSATRVLVNRGWIAAPPDRRQQPVVGVPRGPVAVEGTAVVPSRRIFALAADTAPPGGNAVWQNLDLERYRGAARHPVQPVVIQLSPASPDGFDRDWPRLDARHERHLSYAFQWYGFALASAGIWLFFAFGRTDRGRNP